MNLESLGYLMMVTKQHSFTKAAKNIPISQQGLSKSIKHLENEFGFQMLDRSGRQVVLTAAARELEPEIKAVLDAYQKLQSKAMRLRASEIDRQGIYRLYATAFFTEVISNVLENELGASGFDKVPIMEEDVLQILAAVENDPTSTAALVNMIPNSNASVTIPETIVFEPLFSIESVVVASTKLLSPRITTLTKKHLETLPLVYLNESLFNQITLPLLEYYQPKNIIAHTSNLNRLYETVEKGKGAMLTDSLQAYERRKSSQLVFFPLDKPVYSNVGFLYSGNADLEPGLRKLVETLRRLMQTKWRTYIKRHPPVP